MVSLQDAQANGYVASMKNSPETKMGILHAAYGVGAFAAPLAATQFAQMERWSFHFLVSLGIALINTFALVGVFKGRNQTGLLRAPFVTIISHNILFRVSKNDWPRT